MMMSQVVDHDLSSGHHMTRSQGGRPVEIDLEEMGKKVVDIEVEGGVRPNSSEFYFGDTTTKVKGPEQAPPVVRHPPMPKPITKASPPQLSNNTSVTPMEVEEKPRSIIDNLSSRGSVHSKQTPM